MAEPLEYFFFKSRGNPTYENESKTKRQSVAHGDDSSTVNCRTKIHSTFRGTFGIFRGRSISKLLFLYPTIFRGARKGVRGTLVAKHWSVATALQSMP